jgi:hypothetical protein
MIESDADRIITVTDPIGTAAAPLPDPFDRRASDVAMTTFRFCLIDVLAGSQGELPQPEGDELAFWRQWLAQRNLGLVPIAAPDAFSWPGYWIALVDGNPVLMYGSPSGPVRPWEPAGPIEAGFVVAPFDLGLDPEQPYGAAPGEGVVAALLLAPEAEADLTRAETATAIAGCGLDGDRYARGVGTFSGSAGTGYELTLVAAEMIHGILSWEDARRNVVTQGIDLNALVGRDFKVGDVVCRAQRLAEPCAHLEGLTEPGILRPLVHRAGIRADILVGGEIAVGDRVVPL